MMLLAAASLAILGARLWPWADIPSLPGGGSVALDPALCLLAQVALIFWISSGMSASTRTALSAGAVLGGCAGVALVAYALLNALPNAPPFFVQPVLQGMAAILCGFAGLRGGKATGNRSMGALSGLWAAMLASLLAGTAVLAGLYLGPAPRESSDLWKQYEGLAIGSPAAQALVHTLNTATSFLLAGPLAGAALGALFAYLGRSRAS
jgi:hypothetical protein